MERALLKIQSTIPELNRIQDQWIRILNPLLRAVMLSAVRYTKNQQPTATAKLSGVFIRVKDNGRPEQMMVCLENSNGGWEWVSVATSS